MSNQATARDYELSPVKFSRLTRRGVLLGLSGSQLVVVGTGAIVLVSALYFGGGESFMYVVPVLLLCAGLAFVGVGLSLVALIGRGVWSGLLVGMVFGASFYLIHIVWITRYLGVVPWFALAGLETVFMGVGSIRPLSSSRSSRLS